MATDILVSPIVDLLLGKLGPLAYQQVCLMYGVEKDLQKLQTTLTTIKNGLLDAEEQQLHNRQVGAWLEELKDVCYDAEDVFDEFQAEALRRQVLAEHGSIPTKVCNALSWPKSLAFRFNIGHKIKEIRERLDEIASNQTKFGFTNRVENRINVRRQRETHSFVVASEIIGRGKDKEEYLIEDIGNLKALRILSICNCPNLVSLPSSMKCLSSLEGLFLVDCEKLNLDWGRGMEEEDTHQDLNGTRPHLRALYLEKLPKLVELPQWLLRCSANTLQWLGIEECPNLLALPDSLQNLKSLRSFLIQDCPNVSSLPQDMHGLTTLERIEIGGCPTLSERCEQGSGEDWPQIAHVPNIWLDGDLIIK
ncbi:hypothetical protein LWI29_017321 [Acer saccharum]|uniref:Disease resistance N-terminal domain-containing protein n=1 Tax=Acer saccharum TaxID=4024 RepID=A0AA39SU20_ACESA|nr:hypothetical protein LWI29_017321 [Acer saccharum]